MNHKLLASILLLLVLSVQGEIIFPSAGGGGTVSGSVSNTYSFSAGFNVTQVTNVFLNAVLSNLLTTGVSQGSTNAGFYISSASGGKGTNTTIQTAATILGHATVATNLFVTNNADVAGALTVTKDSSGQRLLFGPTSRFIFRHTNGFAQLFDNGGTPKLVWTYDDTTRAFVFDASAPVEIGNTLTLDSDLFALGNSGFAQAFPTNLTMPTVTVSRAAVFDSLGQLTNAAGTPDGTKFLRDDNTYATPPGGSTTPGGATPMIQMNMGGAFVGTTNLTYDVTNSRVSLSLGSTRPTADIELGGSQPAIRLGGGGPIYTNVIQPTGMLYYGTAITPAFYLYDGGATLSASYFISTNAVYPGITLSGGLGKSVNQWKSNHLSHTKQYGPFSLIPAVGTQLGANVFADGDLGTLFTNVFNAASGTTNLYTTNLNDGQTIHWWLYPSNGVTVGFPQFAATDYTDGAVVPIATNSWSEVEITRRGSLTNIHVKSATFALQAGTGVAFSTNYDTRTIVVGTTNRAASVATNATNLQLDFSDTANLQILNFWWHLTTNVVINPTNLVVGRTMAIYFATNSLTYDVTVTNPAANPVLWNFNIATNGSTSFTKTNARAARIFLTAETNGTITAEMGYYR
jgi:hypothetical protein